MWNGEDEVLIDYVRNNECLCNVVTTLHTSGGWHKLNRIKLYCVAEKQKPAVRKLNIVCL